MESSASLRSFQCLLGSVSQPRFVHGGPAISFLPSGNCGWKSNLYLKNKSITIASCVNTPDSAVAATSSGSSEKKIPRSLTFPSEFEDLVLEVCDETEIAELKLKIGDFEMHLKRNVGTTAAPSSSAPLAAAPPIPTEAVNESPAAPSPPPPESPERTAPFINVSFGKSRKLADLDASGTNYVLVYCPAVGTFQRSRIVRGMRGRPAVTEGSVIKEGQVIGFLESCGRTSAIKSNVDGEVLKVLVNDEDAVGYGDPLIAVLPSFHGINT